MSITARKVVARRPIFRGIVSSWVGGAGQIVSEEELILKVHSTELHMTSLTQERVLKVFEPVEFDLRSNGMERVAVNVCAAGGFTLLGYAQEDTTRSSRGESTECDL